MIEEVRGGHHFVESINRLECLLPWLCRTVGELVYRGATKLHATSHLICYDLLPLGGLKVRKLRTG